MERESTLSITRIQAVAIATNKIALDAWRKKFAITLFCRVPFEALR
jgi:hypothetical protein